MSNNNDAWPSGMYSRETWQNDGQRICRPITSCKSNPIMLGELSEKRKCLYGPRSFSESQEEKKYLKQSDQCSDDTPSTSRCESDKKLSKGHFQKYIADSESDVEKVELGNDEKVEKNNETTKSSEEQELSESWEEDDLSDHMYVNVSNFNDSRETSTSSSSENISNSSKGVTENISENVEYINIFENVEYMKAGACNIIKNSEKEEIRTGLECVYSIPQCNCVLKRKTDLNKKTVKNPTPDLNDQSTRLDLEKRPESAGYVCMDSYILMSPIPKTPMKETYHIYENAKDWINDENCPFKNCNQSDQQETSKPLYTKEATDIPENEDVLTKEDEVSIDESSNIKLEEEKSKRLSSQNVARKSRIKKKPFLDRKLLAATLAKQQLESPTENTDVTKNKEPIGEPCIIMSDKKTIKRNNSKLDSSRQFTRQIHIPNLHPVLMRFLKSSASRKRHLEEEMENKGFKVLWPQTDEGILALVPDLCIRISNAGTEDEIVNTFNKRLWDYFVDDSIYVAEEIGEDLTAILKATPLVTNCTIYNEDMNWVIIGDKNAVKECKCQLLAVLRFLELRLKASGSHIFTKRRYLSGHLIRLVFENKLIDKFRANHETLQIEICDKFQYIKFGGDINVVDSVMKELHEFIQTVQGVEYKCSPLVKDLLTSISVKTNLQDRLRDHELVCTWKITESTCIIYGTTLTEIQSAKDLLKKLIVSETIELSEGQSELMQARFGRAEIKVMMKKYGGRLLIELSDGFIEIACTRNIQEEVCKRLKKFLHKHEIVKRVHEIDYGLFNLLQRHHFDKLTTLKTNCKELLVEMNLYEEKSKCGFVLIGKRDFCKIAVQELEKTLAYVTRFEHTIKRTGLIKFLQTDEGRNQISILESKSQCIVHYSDGNPVTQNKVCVCLYGDIELSVLQADISAVSKGLAYIPCRPSCDEMSNFNGDMPRQLIARECMISPDNKHMDKSNFFACLPNTGTWETEICDAVKASVGLCLKEANKRVMKSVAFLARTTTTEIPPADYAKVLVETVKAFLDGEKRLRKLKTVIFCAEDTLHLNCFVKAFKHVFCHETVQVSSSIHDTSVLKPTTLMELTCTDKVHRSTALLDNDELVNGNHKTVTVNLVKCDTLSAGIGALFIPTNKSFDLPQMHWLNTNMCNSEEIKKSLLAKFPLGLTTGEIVSTILDGFNCGVVYLANLEAPTMSKDTTRKILETVIRGIVDRCIEDEIETLAIVCLKSGLYQLAEVIFNALEPYKNCSCILETINIIVDPQDRSSYLPFEEMKKQFYDHVMPIDHDKCSQHGKDRSMTGKSVQTEEKTEPFIFTEGTVEVNILMGDVTKEATDVIVNSVHGNLDLSASILARAVSKAAGSDLQTELKTKQNLSNMRRDGIVVTGPGRLNCKYIFHVKIKGSIEGWKAAISICLQNAEDLGISSVAFPALGTGRKGIKPHYFTKTILKCIRKFAATNPRSLRHVRLVIFEEAMFKTVLQKAKRFKSGKQRHTLKEKIYDLLKKESPKLVEDEVRLQIYTSTDTVETVKRQLDELCIKASSKG